MNGFYIQRLVIKGAMGQRNASIEFTKGANLVTGASDTGKSYIFSALSYALGGTEAPKEINESVGYTTVYLQICEHSTNKIYSLKRKIGKNHIEVLDGSLLQTNRNRNITKYETTGYADREDHISTFLLSLSGLGKRKILNNKSTGATQNLTFTSLRKLTFVDEQTIIKTSSPFYYSQQFSEQIAAQSLLRLLLTGEDHSDVVIKEDNKTRETRIGGKLELIQEQISQLALQKENTVLQSSSLSASEEERYKQLDVALQQNLTEAKKLTAQKNELISSSQILANDIVYKRELRNRFSILQKQYEGDANRLEFILETDVLSSQIGDVICPICSSPIDEDHIRHFREKENFQLAAMQELIKNKSKLAGLEDTIRSLEEEILETDQHIRLINNKLTQLEAELINNFNPQIELLKNGLKQFVDFEKLFAKISFIDEQLRKLTFDKTRLSNLLKQKNPKEDINLVSYNILTSLSEKIKSRLERWNYESSVDVSFDGSYQVFDISISGKNRKSYGKGKRAISYAACLLGLLDYCHDNQLPFSNLIVMDSPLTTFEEKKKQTEGSEIQTEVMKSFFQDLGTLPNDCQVIVLDNKQPDATLRDVKINIQEFTGMNEGRYGFFPRT